jgi:hypothetical protein
MWSICGIKVTNMRKKTLHLALHARVLIDDLSNPNPNPSVTNPVHWLDRIAMHHRGLSIEAASPWFM